MQSPTREMRWSHVNCLHMGHRRLAVVRGGGGITNSVKKIKIKKNPLQQHMTCIVAIVDSTHAAI